MDASEVKVKPEEAMDKLEDERLDAYNEQESLLSLKQAKIARVTTKGLLRKKQLGLGRVYKNSKTVEGQEKYKKWLGECEALEMEVIRWELVIDKKKVEDEERRTKKTQEQL